MLERCIRRGAFSAGELIDAFNKVRRYKDVPQLFGIEAHPLLKGYRNFSRWHLRAVLVKIFYRVDLESLFSKEMPKGKRIVQHGLERNSL